MGLRELCPLALIGQTVLEKIFENGGRADG